MVTTTIENNYWVTFALKEEDIEFLYNHLLELETPLTSQELVSALVEERIGRQKQQIEKQRTSGGHLYQPKNSFSINQKLIFPAFDWTHGEVTSIRPGENPDLGDFQPVIQVRFDSGIQREFAAKVADHLLNQPPKIMDDNDQFDRNAVLEQYSDDLIDVLEEDLNRLMDELRQAEGGPHEPLPPAVAAPTEASTPELRHADNLFPTVDGAVQAARRAFEQLGGLPLALRERMIGQMRRAARENAQVLARMALDETGMGRLEDKIEKNLLNANKAPGTEMLTPTAWTGDDGMALVEYAPYGVIGSITPSTNPTSSVMCTPSAWSPPATPWCSTPIRAPNAAPT